MKLIILIGLLLSVTAVAPKSIEQKAAGIAEQRARQLDQGPATFESRDENGEEQVLQKMLRIRYAVQEADSELIQAEREAADPLIIAFKKIFKGDNVAKVAKGIEAGIKAEFAGIGRKIYKIFKGIGGKENEQEAFKKAMEN